MTFYYNGWPQFLASGQRMHIVTVKSGRIVSIEALSALDMFDL